MLNVTHVATPSEHRRQTQDLRAESTGQPTVLMAETSSDNAAPHATEFLRFAVCLVFVGDPHGTPQAGPHPPAAPQKSLQVNSVKQLQVLWPLTWRILAKITVRPPFARDLSVWLCGYVCHHTPLSSDSTGGGCQRLKALLVRGRARSHLILMSMSENKLSPWLLGNFRPF